MNSIVKVAYLCCTLCVMELTYAQSQFVKFNLPPTSAEFSFKAYHELKEQLDIEPTTWHTMNYQFSIHTFLQKADFFEFELCYSNEFYQLFEGYEEIASMPCQKIRYYSKLDSICLIDGGLGAKLDKHLLSFKKLAEYAESVASNYTMASLIKNDVQYLLLAFTAFQNKNKKLKYTPVQMYIPFYDAYLPITMETEHLGKFNKQKNLEEFHLSYDFTPIDSLNVKGDLGYSRSDHLAFNTRDAFTEIFQSFQRFSLFFEKSAYHLQHNLMLSRLTTLD